MGVLEKLNEHDFATWLDEQYLDGEWGCWFVTASGCPGLLPANNLVRLRSLSLLQQSTYCRLNAESYSLH